MDMFEPAGEPGKPTENRHVYAPLACYVRRRAEARLSICFEGVFLPGFNGTFIGLHLKPGTTVEQAEAMAHMLNEHAPAYFALIGGPSEGVFEVPADYTEELPPEDLPTYNECLAKWQAKSE